MSEEKNAFYDTMNNNQLMLECYNYIKSINLITFDISQIYEEKVRLIKDCIKDAKPYLVRITSEILSDELYEVFQAIETELTDKMADEENSIEYIRKESELGMKILNKHIKI